MRIESKEEVVKSSSNQGLLDEAHEKLKQGKYLAANENFDMILKNDYENSKAHIGKLLIELAIKEEADLINIDTPLTKFDNFKNGLKYADATYADKLIKYNNNIIRRLNSIKKEKELKKEQSSNVYYEEAIELKIKAKTSEDYYKAMAKFGIISDYKDSMFQQAECYKLATHLSKKQYGNITLWFVLNFFSIFISNYLGIIGAIFAFLANNEKKNNNEKKAKRRLRTSKVWFVLGVFFLIVIYIIIPLLSVLFSLSLELSRIFILYDRIIEILS